MENHNLLLDGKKLKMTSSQILKTKNMEKMQASEIAKADSRLLLKGSSVANVRTVSEKSAREAAAAEVLIVDDSEFIIFALQEQLDTLRVSSDVCTSGK